MGKLEGTIALAAIVSISPPQGMTLFLVNKKVHGSQWLSGQKNPEVFL